MKITMREPLGIMNSRGRSAPARDPRGSRPSSAASSASSRREGGAINGMSVTDTIATAISMGAPRYNQGDHTGCYDIYKRTARNIIGQDKLAASDRQLLEDGMRNAQMSN